MNYPRIYEYRFREVDPASRTVVWREISRYLFDRLGRPERVLDPAAGRCEFINTFPAAERWAVDQSPDLERWAGDGVKTLVADAREVDLPPAHFEAVFVSNFLEHLPSPADVASFLERMRACLVPRARIAVLGPNFRYCYREYFDCADHELALTHEAVAEHLYGAGFEIESVVDRFLPFSFRNQRVTPTATMTRAYLRLPLAWRVLGKQFLLIARA